MLKTKKLISLCFLCMSVTFLLSCGWLNLRDRQRQIDTFSRVSTIAKTIDNRSAGSNTPLEASEITEIIQGIGGGFDAWGHRIQVLDGGADHLKSYAVVSPGRDGNLDFSDSEKYFTMTKVDIRELFDRDIVFRDGDCVTNAGKDPHSAYPAPE